MGKNNKMYQCFKQLTEGYKLGTKEGDVMISHGAVNWLSYEPDNPFEPGSQEHNHFDRMQQHYISWKRNGTGSRHSKRQLIAEAVELCKCKPKNPYKFNKQEDELDKQEAKELEAARAKAIQEHEAKEIERRASLIVEEEQRKQAEAEERAKAVAERERRNAEAKAEQNRQAQLLQNAIEAKRAEMNQHHEEKTVVLGVLPDKKEVAEEESVDEEPIVKHEHKLFAWLKREK